MHSCNTFNQAFNSHYCNEISSHDASECFYLFEGFGEFILPLYLMKLMLTDILKCMS